LIAARCGAWPIPCRSSVDREVFRSPATLRPADRDGGRFYEGLEAAAPAMDRNFKLKLYHAIRAMDDAGLSPGITSAFRDDYTETKMRNLLTVRDDHNVAKLAKTARSSNF
jgi:hypothetical protein